MARGTLFASFLLLFVTYTHGQCIGTLLTDISFERGFSPAINTYCRSTAAQLSSDNIRFCTVGYTWDPNRIVPYPSNLWTPAWDGPNNQTSLRTADNFSPNWAFSGQLEVMTANFQAVSTGTWAVRLGGQTSSGSIQQDAIIPSDSGTANIPRPCTLRWGQITNRLSLFYGISYRSPYNVQIDYRDPNNGNYVNVFNSGTLLAPAYVLGSDVQGQGNIGTVMFTPGQYRITFNSEESPSNIIGAGPEFYTFTGVVLDDICFQCGASNPSPSASVTPAPSVSASPSMSVTPSMSVPPCPCCSQCFPPCPSAIVCPPQACPLPPSCPAPPLCPPTGCGCSDTNLNHYTNMIKRY